MGVGNDPRYQKTQCFDPYPFPTATEEEKATIRELGEKLDKHRKERLNQHEDLTMTALYNVLKKEQSEEQLTDEEREIHEKGLVGVLGELHDELDAAVAQAYGWEPGLDDEEILQRLVDLNEKRRAGGEEGHVRWLRPEYQAPEEAETQAEMDLGIEISSDEVAQPLTWPAELRERAQAIRAVMNNAEGPLTVEEVAQHFHRARRDDVRGILETLSGLGLVDREDDVFVA